MHCRSYGRWHAAALGREGGCGHVIIARKLRLDLHIRTLTHAFATGICSDHRHLLWPQGPGGVPRCDLLQLAHGSSFRASCGSGAGASSACLLGCGQDLERRWKLGMQRPGLCQIGSALQRSNGLQAGQPIQGLDATVVRQGLPVAPCTGQDPPWHPNWVHRLPVPYAACHLDSMLACMQPGCAHGSSKPDVKKMLPPTWRKGPAHQQPQDKKPAATC